MCNTNLTREQLVSILSDAQQLVQSARSALTLDVAYKGTKEPALFGFYEDECKAVHKRDREPLSDRRGAPQGHLPPLQAAAGDDQQ